MIFCNHEHLWLRKPDLKSTKCDQKDLNWLCLIQGWWYCYPGFPGWKELQVNVIFWSQALQLRLAFLACLSTTLIKLFQQTPEKTHLPIQTFLPQRGFQKTATAHSQQSPKKEAATVWKQNIIIQENLWIPIRASLGKLPDALGLLCWFQLHMKRYYCGGPQFEVNRQQKIKDSKEMERRKESLHFKYWQKARANFISKLYLFLLIVPYGCIMKVYGSSSPVKHSSPETSSSSGGSYLIPSQQLTVSNAIWLALT